MTTRKHALLRRATSEKFGIPCTFLGVQGSSLFDRDRFGTHYAAAQGDAYRPFRLGDAIPL
jgi:hypothetical protein